MNALRRIHRSLVPGGLLLDVHPTPPDAFIVCGRAILGTFDEEEFHGRVRATEAALDETLLLGWFTLETQRRHLTTDRFDSAGELLERAFERRGSRLPEELIPRIEAAAPPFEIRHHVVLHRLRALVA